MTTNQQVPPSDEVMCKIVAKMEGWDTSKVGTSFWPKFDDEDTHSTFRNDTHNPTASVTDPRTDPNEALKLLHWLCNGHAWLCGYHQSDCFDILDDWDSRELIASIPLSGTPFCTAICCLAATVLEVE